MTPAVNEIFKNPNLTFRSRILTLQPQKITLDWFLLEKFTDKVSKLGGGKCQKSATNQNNYPKRGGEEYN